MQKILFVFILVLLWVRPALAQENVIAYGTNVVGTISAEAPQAEFSFNGTAGDLVTIQAIGITSGLDPAISLNSATQQGITGNDNDSTIPGTTDARVSISLPQSGPFTVLVTSVTGATGEFLLRLSGHTPPSTTALADTPVDASVAPNSPQLFSFNADPAAIITLNVTTATAGFAFRTFITDSNGIPVAMVSGSDIVGVMLAFPPGDSTYTAEISAFDPGASGQVTVFMGDSPAAVQSVDETSAPSPEETPEVLPTDETVSTCGITPNGGEVNVRNGPATTFDIIAQLQPSEVLQATGTSKFWYRVIVPDVGIGWVSDTVVFATGECRDIPEVDPAEAAQETAPVIEATPTFTPAPPVQATPTFTPAPPIQATPTFTPAAPQSTVSPTPAGPTATVTITVTTTPTN